jgi:hypothetical protein
MLGYLFPSFESIERGSTVRWMFDVIQRTITRIEADKTAAHVCSVIAEARSPRSWLRALPWWLPEIEVYRVA